MSTFWIDPERPDPATISRAAAVLVAGGLVAFPTETVYGLGAAAFDPRAVERIYAVKGRPRHNPLIVHTADIEGARRLAAEWSDVAEQLARAFWPGPLTLVVARSKALPAAVSAGLASVALRVPAHPVARALLAAAAIPIAAPSANRSGELSPTTADHVARSLGDRVEMVLDGGPSPVGIESTVVSLLGKIPTILRPGTLSLDALRAVAGGLTVFAALNAEGAPLPSPGMLDRHYAPRAKLSLFDPDAPPAAEPAERAAPERRVAVLVLRAERPPPGELVRMPGDPAAYAARLYATLHQLDEEGYEMVWVERVPPGDAWEGVRDRLRRAAQSA